ncbi:MAG TPA: secretin N-terminal domain-containing protein, partial [Pseudobdellovibrionaceae bacterium]|nr:secretin N-terminal domain-containing protein [Pseudobdellovibrionaceae bacterium]
MSNKVGIRAVTIGIILTQLSNPALAQFEDIAPPPPPDTGISDLPAPPPLDFGDNSLPAPGEGDFGGGANGGGGSVGSPSRPKKTNEIVAKDKRAKLAKASVDEITNENYSETIESFDFPNVDIQEIVKAVSELTGKNFIIDNGIKGKITIIAPSKITVAEAYRAFLSALAMNGFTVVPYGSFLKIRSIRDARSDSIETYSGAYYPTSDQLITKIIHLKHISAEQVQKDLKILASNRGDFSVYQPTNSIILTDFGSSVDRIVKIITQLDVPGFEEKLEVVPIKFAKAKDLADLVDKIVNKGSGNSNRTNT